VRLPATQGVGNVQRFALDRLRQASVIGIIIADTERLINANRFFLDLVGYTEQDLRAGKLRWREMTPPEYAERDERALQEFHTLGVCTPYEKEYFRKDGSRVPVLVVGLFLLGKASKGYVCYVLDRTEQKRVEAALTQSAKLASVGRLAATIAHEINNPLAAAINLLYLLEASNLVKEGGRGYLAQAQQQLARVTEITRSTLGFYKELTPAEAVNVSALIDEVVQLHRQRINDKRVEFASKKETALPIHAVAGEVRQLISNLLANALDAVPEGGSVMVRAQSCRDWRDPNLVGVRITIFDNGPGVPVAHRGKLFEPFFNHEKGRRNWAGPLGLHGNRGTAWRACLPAIVYSPRRNLHCGCDLSPCRR